MLLLLLSFVFVFTICVILLYIKNNTPQKEFTLIILYVFSVFALYVSNTVFHIVIFLEMSFLFLSLLLLSFFSRFLLSRRAFLHYVYSNFIASIFIVLGFSFIPPDTSIELFSLSQSYWGVLLLFLGLSIKSGLLFGAFWTIHIYGKIPLSYVAILSICTTKISLVYTIMFFSINGYYLAFIFGVLTFIGALLVLYIKKNSIKESILCNLICKTGLLMILTYNNIAIKYIIIPYILFYSIFTIILFFILDILTSDAVHKYKINKYTILFILMILSLFFLNTPGSMGYYIKLHSNVSLMENYRVLFSVITYSIPEVLIFLLFWNHKDTFNKTISLKSLLCLYCFLIIAFVSLFFQYTFTYYAFVYDTYSYDNFVSFLFSQKWEAFFIKFFISIVILFFFKKNNILRNILSYLYRLVNYFILLSMTVIYSFETKQSYIIYVKKNIYDYFHRLKVLYLKTKKNILRNFCYFEFLLLFFLFFICMYFKYN